MAVQCGRLEAVLRSQAVLARLTHGLRLGAHVETLGHLAANRLQRLAGLAFGPVLLALAARVEADVDGELVPDARFTAHLRREFDPFDLRRKLPDDRPSSPLESEEQTSDDSRSRAAACGLGAAKFWLHKGVFVEHYTQRGGPRVFSLLAVRRLRAAELKTGEDDETADATSAVEIPHEMLQTESVTADEPERDPLRRLFSRKYGQSEPAAEVEREVGEADPDGVDTEQTEAIA